ncbi:FAD binding domain-containing protein [Arthrobacter bambusae]|uniref:2-polyprenyl-6-methoxyphenol hydroxylase-like FAD-dependent oxidoreductase n=1 Tax=Arthrobacter bambusae TaxID=1338426 RepID=A0AAW8DLB5_9MICC|nr:NAD-binding protein [Arthrobacter bambusae]MDP9906048.1 2-polyprenyl-6-methoxyphenol hydroxylase-like FAD-dependent oxidoreductase [Arthrobacter bambusae]MDQ0131157.1 2-polyprenyl-6-methoxyphenol hydroxylase-like FAD-dependent oxidoreductase [Arthrobacter bambusae]MDQ0181851.1 2-polyprenyl-6-methoxyphenol hydroxylase-like FAD-dependent oxidoreductase [Arthrobacter bambusae]
MKTAAFRAVVVGGSVGGMAAAVRLRRIGADVAVYERSAAVMESRGAGVVMQPEIERLLETEGVDPFSVSVRLEERHQLTRSGERSVHVMAQQMTAWDTLYGVLRRLIGDSCYRRNSALTATNVQDDGVSIEFADGYSTSGDILVAADGVNSTSRKLLGGVDESTYSGYVAWRGLEREGDLPAALVGELANRFTSYSAPGMQFLCYLVPGADGDLRPGHRRVNWVWYVNTALKDLTPILTGRSGRQYKAFLPPGEATTDVLGILHPLAETALPALFSQLVFSSTVFLQPVQDLKPMRMLHGRACLMGDAAGTVRPHTASGTSKAFADAAVLALALDGWDSRKPLPTERLKRWELTRLSALADIAQHGTRLAASSALGARFRAIPWKASA